MKNNPLKDLSSSQIVDYLLEFDIVTLSETFGTVGKIFEDVQKRSQVIARNKSHEKFNDIMRRLEDQQ
jgi:hypothetical protein